MASAAEDGLHCVMAGGSLAGLSAAIALGPAARHVAVSEQATADYLAHAAAGRRS
jgi:2-polyprenyl-6-methoxyphenol hydroxylase-like FAD-dependent oxidoreductase